MAAWATGVEVACHGNRLGRREHAVDRTHLHGIVPGGREEHGIANPGPALLPAALPGTELKRLMSADVDVLPDMLARLIPSA